MASVLTAKSLKAIEKGIREGKCLTVIPGRKGTARVVESTEFLSAEESESLLNNIPRMTPGECLERFIWQFEAGSTKNFASKVGYHPNRISTLKSSTRGISTRLFRRMTTTYKLRDKQRGFWAGRLVNV